MKRVCIVCFRDFETRGDACYCSKRCEKEARMALERDKRKETLGPDGEILIDQGRVRISPIGKVEAEARKRGLSYGQLKAQKWLKETEVIF